MGYRSSPEIIHRLIHGYGAESRKTRGKPFFLATISSASDVAHTTPRGLGPLAPGISVGDDFVEKLRERPSGGSPCTVDLHKFSLYFMGLSVFHTTSSRKPVSAPLVNAARNPSGRTSGNAKSHENPGNLRFHGSCNGVLRHPLARPTCDDRTEKLLTKFSTGKRTSEERFDTPARREI